MGTVNINSSYIPVGPRVCLFVFRLPDLSVYFWYVLFYLGQLDSFPFMSFPFQFLLSPRYCGLGAGSTPFRAIVNNKQCEMRGLFMSPVIHYWIKVQDSQGVSASEMTYIVSGGALNSTHSLRLVSSESTDRRGHLAKISRVHGSTAQATKFSFHPGNDEVA